MKIVFLNTCFLTKEHINRLKKFGSVKIYSDTIHEKEAISRLRGATIAVANGMVATFTKKVFANSPDLRFLILNSTGFDFVDLAAARAYGVRVANLPGYATDAVAEHVFALLLAVNRKIVMQDKKMRQKPFQINPANPQNRKFLSTNLRDKTLGVLGFGSIGRRVAELGQTFGMKILVHDQIIKPSTKKIAWVSKGTLIRKSDIISLHLPLTAHTMGIIGPQELRSMKRGAILINTSRGKLVDERALYHALKNGKLSGAGLDVLADVSFKNPLLRLSNVVFTSHSAWWTKESLDNQAEMIVQTIQKILSKKRVSFVI